MFLRIVTGEVELINGCGQRVKTYYSGAEGNAVRADWYSEKNQIIQVQLENGRILLINSGCQVIRHI